jgi:MFS family permease
VTTTASEPARSGPVSAWEPLRYPVFRAFWLAVLASQIGTWMQNAGAAWLMSTLAASPALVALMQTATSLPTCIFGLPAGALADIVDRRRLLILAQTWMLVAALALAALTIAGAITPLLLLLLTLAIGIGVAFTGPAWQATAPYLVPRHSLARAVALNGVAVNVGRAVGPAAGGVVLAAAGAGAVFLVNAASFGGMIGVLAVRGESASEKRTLPGERLSGAVRAGLRYLLHAPPLTAVLVRATLFVIGASALFGLMPVIARDELGLGSAGFGLLLAIVGAGAILGAGLLPRLRSHLSRDRVVATGTVLFGTATLVLALVPSLWAVAPAMLAAGLGWITALATLNVSAQRAAPAWVRARALGSYLVVFQGGLALGSALWGVVASLATTRTSLVAAGAFMLAGLVAERRWRLQDELLDLSVEVWPEPLVANEPELDQGPVLVTIDYRIDPGQADDFVGAMEALGRIRRRDGAYRWGLFVDLQDPARYLETFLVESWIEHLRQHQRGTVTDRDVRERAASFHVGEEPPDVSHLVAAARLAGPFEPGVRTRWRVREY